MKHPILWALSIWGEPYWDLFNKFHAPAMLLPGNLDALQDLGEPVQCMIFTDAAGWRTARPGIEALRHRLGPDNVIGVQVPLSQFTHDGLRTHQIMFELQRFAVHEALQRKAALVWTFPDILMPEGQYAGLLSDLEGDEVGCLLGRFASIDGRIPELADGLEGFPELQAPKMFAQELFKPELIHSAMKRCIVEGKGPRSDWPASLWWHVPNGFVCHGFHMDPLICWPTAIDDANWKQALDISFTTHATFLHPKVQVARRFTSVEIAMAPKLYGEERPPMNKAGIAQWALNHATTHGREAFRQPLLCGEAQLGSAVETMRWAYDVYLMTKAKEAA